MGKNKGLNFGKVISVDMGKNKGLNFGKVISVDMGMSEVLNFGKVISALSLAQFYFHFKLENSIL
jgi:hypothetical protein